MKRIVSQAAYDVALAKLITNHADEFDKLKQEEAVVFAAADVAYDLARMTRKMPEFRITAIKIIRNAFNLGLRESKDAFEAGERRLEAEYGREKLVNNIMNEDMYEDLPF